MMNFTKSVKDRISQTIQTHILIADEMSEDIANAGNLLFTSLVQGNKVLSCGNGGSAALSQYFNALLLHRFEMDRPSLPSISLNANAITMSSIANESGYGEVFSQQIQALGNQGDILLAISTNGNSDSIYQAIQKAQQENMHIISLTGKDGGRIRSLYRNQDIELCVPANETAYIQEAQMLLLNCLCNIIDKGLFGI